ncbi:MAG: SUMF1/EgtB/PvdO family nonheme iron enzyme [Desulfococcaceae bacterium]
MQPADSLSEGKSPYVLCHMAGNVREWVADYYDLEYYTKGVKRNPEWP